MPQEERIQAEGRVKQAVKEAMSERDITDIKSQLVALKLQITEGFSGVHERQDTTNGKVLKAREDIQNLQSENKVLADKVSTITKIMYGIGSLIGLTILGAILKQVIK